MFWFTTARNPRINPMSLGIPLNQGLQKFQSTYWVFQMLWGDKPICLPWKHVLISDTSMQLTPAPMGRFLMKNCVWNFTHLLEMIYWEGSVQQAPDSSDTLMGLLQHSWQLTLVNNARMGFSLFILHRGSKLLSCLLAFGMNLGHHKRQIAFSYSFCLA